MPVPDFQSLTLPVLREFADGRGTRNGEIKRRIAEHLKRIDDVI